MIFLNPAILFGLLAAAIPVLIHLLNLRKLKHIEFSTLSFLKELQKNKIRKIKIKQWLLLALRVLLILLIVAAFARPTLKGVAIGGTTSAAKTTAVFILDDTFSMSVVAAEGSYYNRAREILETIAGSLEEGDEAVLITVSNAAKNEYSATGNLNDVIKRIQEHEISYATGTLNDALVKAAEVTGKSRNFNKEIYIISDYQKGRLYESESSLSDLGLLLDENVKIYTFILPEKDIFNISIDDLQLNTTIFQKDKPVTFNVTVTNYSSGNIENGVVSLFINGSRSAQQSFSLNALASQTLSIEAHVKSTGYIDVVAELEDDDINADNKRYLSFNIPEEIPIGIFTADNTDTRFIKTALNAYESGSVLNIRNFNIGQFSSLNPEQFSVIIICGYGEFNAQRLTPYLENGGGLIILPGQKATIESFNPLLTAAGLPPAGGTSGAVNRDNSYSIFETTAFEHPLFKDIFSAGQKHQIESPEVYHSFNIKPGTSGSTIISLNNGNSFLSEYAKGQGRILLFSTAPVLSWSNFPLKSIFPPLINRSVYYLASKASAESYTAGSELNVYVGRAQQSLTLEIPGKDEEFVTLSDKENGYVKLTVTDKTGIYKYFSGDKSIKQISINTDPAESVTEHLGADEVKEYLDKVSFRGHFYTVSSEEDPVEMISQARYGSELWKHFLLAALLIALVEMAVARSAKKDLVTV